LTFTTSYTFIFYITAQYRLIVDVISTNSFSIYNIVYS